jgi:GntR family transcriptional regulator, transcriptional repressor for pyruvate dehydrogenase complex
VTEPARDSESDQSQLDVVKVPRLAEVVAAKLREQIVSGGLADGSELPNQDRLSERFGISRNSLREAIRILESERLVTVRRGKVGGAVVHAPSTPAAAYALGLVLQGKGVPVKDLAVAIEFLEVGCAALCAERPDRMTEVLPELERVVKNIRRKRKGKPDAYAGAERQLHAALLSLCGNSTMAAIGGLVEDLMVLQQRHWLGVAMGRGLGPNESLRAYDAEAHNQIISAIRSGDPEAAGSATRDYLQQRSGFYKLSFDLEPIQVAGTAAP